MSTMWLMSAMLIIMMASAVQFIQKKQTISKEKSSHFECGFNKMTPPHLPFSFQFFLVALLFLIFDVEISLMMIYPLEQTTTKNLSMIYTFLLILTIGLLYEWQKGKINWSE